MCAGPSWGNRDDILAKRDKKARSSQSFTEAAELGPASYQVSAPLSSVLTLATAIGRRRLLAQPSCRCLRCRLALPGEDAPGAAGGAARRVRPGEAIQIGHRQPVDQVEFSCLLPATFFFCLLVALQRSTAVLALASPCSKWHAMTAHGGEGRPGPAYTVNERLVREHHPSHSFGPKLDPGKPLPPSQARDSFMNTNLRGGHGSVPAQQCYTARGSC
jgi:hypothetical protein